MVGRGHTNPFIMPHLDFHSLWNKQMFQGQKKKVLTLFLDIPASLAAALRVEALCAGFFFSFSFSFWCELHSGQRSICRRPRISLLKTPLSAVGMSCKVQAKSSSQWECNSLLGDAHLHLCTPSFSSPSHVRDGGDNLFPFLVYIMRAHADL